MNLDLMLLIDKQFLETPFYGVRQMNDAQPLWVGPPPSQRNTPPPADLEDMLAILEIGVLPLMPKCGR